MDRICGALLDKINSVTPRGQYAIIAEDEFFEVFPDGTERSYDQLYRALNVLKNEGFIDVKYSRGDMYCVSPLKEFAEDTTVPQAAEKPKRTKTDFVFISAFIGGALGSLIVSLIFALL